MCSNTILGPTDGKGCIVWQAPMTALSRAAAHIVTMNRVNISGQVRCRSVGIPLEIPFSIPRSHSALLALNRCLPFLLRPPARQHLFAGRRQEGVVGEASARSCRQPAERQGGVRQEILVSARGFRCRRRASHLGESGFLEGRATCFTNRGSGACVVMRHACALMRHASCMCAAALPCGKMAKLESGPAWTLCDKAAWSVTCRSCPPPGWRVSLWRAVERPV